MFSRGGTGVRLGSRFQLLWAAATLSGLGDGMRFVALPLLAAQASSDPRAVSLVLLAQQLPWLLIGLFAGALADRLDRRRLMWVVDSGRAVLIGAFAIAVGLGVFSIIMVATVGFLLGCAKTLYSGASSAILPALVGTDDLSRANARLQGGELVSNSLVGTLLGAVLFSMSAAAPFSIDAVSFALAAVLIACIPGDFRTRPTDTSVTTASLRGDVVDGVRWLWRQPLLRQLCLMAGVANLAAMGMLATLVLYARHVLGLDDFGYGLLITSFAVGGLAGATLAPTLSARLGVRSTLRLAIFGSVAAAAGIGVTSSGIAAACWIAVYSAAILVWEITALSLRQALTPAGVLGRVTVAYQIVSKAAGAAGIAAGGVVAHLLGLRGPFLAGAVLLLAAALASEVPCRAKARASDLHQLQVDTASHSKHTMS